MSSFWKLVVAIAICEGTGIVSGFVSQANMNPWFDALNKPNWNPPAWIFAPVWTLLYLLMGIALWLVWKSNMPKPKKLIAILVFALQLFFNFLWSILFFNLHSPLAAFVCIVLLLGCILITIFIFAKISQKAAWLLLPYVAWVSFATMLNCSIWL
jgi:translocator protein